MKTLFTSVACALLSTLAADPSPAADPTPVVPRHCLPETAKSCNVTYELYGECLFLQPNGSDLYYGAEAIGLDSSIAVPAASPNWKVLEINPDYHFGFEVGTSVLFSTPNIKIDLNWERLHAHDSDSFEASSAPGYMVGPFFDIGPNSDAYKIARGHATSRFDAVNLNFGKQLCFFKNFHTNFYGGVGFARIKQTIKSSYSNVAGTIARHVKTSSTFIGAGPQLGLDYDYRICKNFLFTGTSVVSLLMGQLKNGTTFRTYTPELTTLGIPQPNVQKTSVPNRAQLTPAFEQKLGFSYSAIWDCVKATFGIGYQCQIYMDAVQTVDMKAPQVLPTGAQFTTQVGVFAVGFERTISNYMLTGPYASVNIEF